MLLVLLVISCEEEIIKPPSSSATTNTGVNESINLVEGVDYSLPHIELNNWKVTLPIPRSDGKLLEVQAPDIFDYANNKI